MKIVMENIRLIEQVDQLIRMKATGKPEEFANRLRISKTKLYRTFNIMKTLGAPIVYDFTSQNFYYDKVVSFKFGFYTEKAMNTYQYR